MRYLVRAGAMSCLALAAASVSAQDEGGDAGRGLVLSPVQIFADDGVAGVPGSASVVEDIDLEQRRPASTLDTLQTLPGVTVVSEDPLG